MHDMKAWAELYPLMAALFLAMVWHSVGATRRSRSPSSGPTSSARLLERQERFIHDASHELRTPVTIARGHLELLAGGRAEVDVALEN